MDTILIVAVVVVVLLAILTRSSGGSALIVALLGLVFCAAILVVLGILPFDPKWLADAFGLF